MATRLTSMSQYVAVDPLSLILPAEIYVLINGPRPPEEIRERVRSAVKTMTAKDKKNALANAEAMIAYASILKEELCR